MKYKKLPNKLLPFLWLFLKKYKYKFLFYVIFAVFIIDVPTMFLQPYLMKIFFDKVAENTITITNGLILVAGIACSDVYLFIEIIIDILEFNSIAKIVEDIRYKIFKHLLRQSVNFFNTNYSGELISKIEVLTNSLRRVISISLRTLKNLFLLFCLSFTMFIFGKWLGILMLIWFIIYCLIYYYLVVKKALEQSKLIQNDQNKIVAFVNDDFVNVQNIKAFSNNKLENNILIRLLVSRFKKILLETRYIQISDFLFFILNFSVIAIIMTFGIIQFKYGLITLGSFVFLLDILRRFISLSKEICYCSEDFKDIIVMQDCLNLISNDIEIEDKKDAKELEITGGKIVFKNVSFSYKK